ncbi:LEA type 2 family protein [Salinispira pacifica]
MSTALSLFLLLILAACESPPPAPPPTPSAPLEISITSVRVSAVDLDNVRFSFSLRVENPGTGPAQLISQEAKLYVEGKPVWSSVGSEPLSIAAGAAHSIPYALELPRSRLQETVPGFQSKNELSWQLSASASTRLADGRVQERSADRSGSFPIVRAPELEIRSLKIERYDLIETKLKLTIAVRNPNSFPLTFKSVDYIFSAEGRVWGEGTAAIPKALPPGNVTEVQIPLTLNFIEMGRNLLDTVAALGIVHYRLQAVTSVTTPLEFITGFSSRFDRQGAIRVEK